MICWCGYALCKSSTAAQFCHRKFLRCSIPTLSLYVAILRVVPFGKNFKKSYVFHWKNFCCIWLCLLLQVSVYKHGSINSDMQVAAHKLRTFTIFLLTCFKIIVINCHLLLVWEDLTVWSDLIACMYVHMPCIIWPDCSLVTVVCMKVTV